MASERSDYGEQQHPIEQFTEQEACELFNRAAQRYLNMSGAEFIQRYDAGEFDDDPDRPGVMSMILLLPLVQHPFRSIDQ